MLKLTMRRTFISPHFSLKPLPFSPTPTHSHLCSSPLPCTPEHPSRTVHRNPRLHIVHPLTCTHRTLLHLSPISAVRSPIIILSPRHILHHSSPDFCPSIPNSSSSSSLFSLFFSHQLLPQLRQRLRFPTSSPYNI